MPLLCSYCHKEITEAPIAAIHLGCAPKVMELAATDSQQLKAEIRAMCIELECTSHDKFDCGMYHALRGRLRELSAV